MDRLPISLLDKTRSYLDYFQLHSSQAVCNDWNDIDHVKKSLHLTQCNAPVIPDDANFSNVVSLKVTDTDAGNQCLRVLKQIVTKSSGTLHSLNLLDIWVDELHGIMESIPALIKLETLNLDGEMGQDEFRAFSEKIPNISCMRMALYYHPYTMDFLRYPSIQSLTIHDIEGNLRFVNGYAATNLKEINFEDPMNPEWGDWGFLRDRKLEQVVSWMQIFPQCKFSFTLQGEDNDHTEWGIFWIRIEIDGDILQFNYFQTESEHDFSDKLFEIFGTLSGIRRFKFTCAPEMKLEEKETLCANLCRTGLFDQKQLEPLLENI